MITVQPGDSERAVDMTAVVAYARSTVGHRGADVNLMMR